jgi:hypothetical protein
MSQKKVNVTITTGCRGAGQSLTRGQVYSLPAADAQLIVSAGRGTYGGDLKKRSASKPDAKVVSKPTADKSVS